MMKSKKASLACGDGKFNLELKVCNNLEKFFGLMFKRRKNAEALLFDFKKPTNLAIHSVFVFFPFLALWLDDKNKIVDLKLIEPFTFSVKSGNDFCKIIEIPVNDEFAGIIKLVVGNSKDLNIEFA